MDELQAMRVFAAVAQHQSFTGAARALGTSRPSVSRQIAQLETSLGAELLVRTTRRLALTRAGERYLEDAGRILDAVTEARAVVAGLHARPAGVLSVTAPVLFGRLHVAPIIAEVTRQYPQLRVRLTLLDRVTNLIEEGFDVGIRISHLADSSMVVSRAGHVRRQIVASPDYLAAHGTPENPQALTKHAIIGRLGPDSTRWSFAGGQTIDVDPLHWTNDISAGLELARRGVGLFSALSYQVSGDLASGALVVVLSGAEPAAIPVSILRPAGRPSAKARAFIDLALAVLRRRSESDWRLS